MPPNKYVQFLNEHRIGDNLLREFLYKEKFIPARDQIESAIAVYHEKISCLKQPQEYILMEIKKEKE